MTQKSKIATLPSASQFKRSLQAEGRPLFFVFDFDGTLVNFNPDPQKVALTESVKASLDRLSQLYPHQIMVLSGRSFNDLNRFFKDRPVWLTGEHGAESSFWQLVVDHKSLKLPQLTAYLKNLTEAYPGSFTEEKNFSKVFHYRKAQHLVSDELALGWVRNLNQLLAATNLRSYLYNKVIEIKPLYCSKKDYLNEFRKSLSPQTSIICFGDDIPDQEIFDAWKAPELISVGVGERIERAAYKLNSPTELEVWLEEFISN